MRITALEIHDYKKIKNIRLEMGPSCIVKLVGQNAAGKSSIIDAIAATLGGNSYAPEKPIRKGAKTAEVIVEIGDMVIRKVFREKNNALELTLKGIPQSSPQKILNTFVGQFTFDPESFVRMKPAEQIEYLANIAGVSLAKYEAERKEVMEARRNIGRIVSEWEVRAKEQIPVDAPESPVTADSIQVEYNQAVTKNAEFEKHRRALSDARAAVNNAEVKRDVGLREVERFRALLEAAEQTLKQDEKEIVDSKKRLAEAAEAMSFVEQVDLKPYATKFAEIGELNKKYEKRLAIYEAKKKHREFSAKYDEYTEKLAQLKQNLDNAIGNAKMPVKGLSLEEDGVYLKGVPFSQASNAEQIRTSVAIGIALNPELKLMMIKNGSLLDDTSMEIVAEMAERAGAQLFIERVEREGEEGIWIVDGEIDENKSTHA